MLPLLISTPHCSGQAPGDILARMLETGEAEEALKRRLLKEGDPYTDEIFRLPQARATVNATASRFVVDLNRERNEGGENGVIKRTDFARVPFYRGEYVLDEAERERRLSLYYDPYHRALETAIAAGGIRFFIDGHSMEARGPAIGPDGGKPRPALCIGNFGDENGDSLGGPTSCDPELARRIRFLLNGFIANLLREPGAPQGVLLNNPFDGGHILSRYTRPPFAIPGVMIEVNRALYLDEETLQPLPGRIEKLRTAFARLAEAILAP
jgi:N-formylglutamate deformylase